jgi:hypothetical protein
MFSVKVGQSWDKLQLKKRNENATNATPKKREKWERERLRSSD